MTDIRARLYYLFETLFIRVHDTDRTQSTYEEVLHMPLWLSSRFHTFRFGTRQRFFLFDDSIVCRIRPTDTTTFSAVPFDVHVNTSDSQRLLMRRWPVRSRFLRLFDPVIISSNANESSRRTEVKITTVLRSVNSERANDRYSRIEKTLKRKKNRKNCSLSFNNNCLLYK